MERFSFLRIALILGLATTLAGFSASGFGSDPSGDIHLTKINPDYMVKPHEAYRWHLIKDSIGPAFAGTPSWSRYLHFPETKLKEYGVVGIQKNKWAFNHWYTTEWPDDSSWALVSDGKPARVAHYGAYSVRPLPKESPPHWCFTTQPNPLPALRARLSSSRPCPHPSRPTTSDSWNGSLLTITSA